MNCCSRCFKDKEVIGFIFSNSIISGKCNYCYTENVDLIDPRELEELFAPILGIYQSANILGIDIENGERLPEKIQSDWNIFENECRNTDQLLKDIFRDSIQVDDPIFTDFVSITAIHQANGSGEDHELKWENFAEEIKTSNRFFLKETVDLKLLGDLLKLLEKTYSKGKIFYRARISDKDGFTAVLLGKPPSDVATAGRANPKGIPYLYVSAEQKTTEYESRSSYLDYITIGTFKLSENLSVISLRDTQKISPFVLETNIENYVIHQKYLARLEQELSKPIRRFDKELDYLPTQYLCEYVKSLGYDAIEYGSALHKGGVNLAIFNDDKIECRSVEVFEVNSMELHLEKIIE